MNQIIFEFHLPLCFNATLCQSPIQESLSLGENSKGKKARTVNSVQKLASVCQQHLPWAIT